MIFLSHTHADKVIVDTLAQRLAAVFGQDAIFYDSWSIQPGDGIIARMNQGLADCRVFFFFVSKRSLQSELVRLEWQNALLKATRGEVKLIPVRIDDVLMPQVLLQTLYIDLFTQGFDTALRQMIDVASGRSTYSASNDGSFQNIRAHLTRNGREIVIEFRAEVYMEPHSRYLVLVRNSQDELTWAVEGETMFESGFNEGLEMELGGSANAILVARTPATSPGFPFIVRLTPTGGADIAVRGVMRQVSRERFTGIPLVEEP